MIGILRSLWRSLHTNPIEQAYEDAYEGRMRARKALARKAATNCQHPKQHAVYMQPADNGLLYFHCLDCGKLFKRGNVEWSRP